MKRQWAWGLLGWAVMSTALVSSADDAARKEFRKRLNTTRVPTLDVREAALTEVLETLSASWETAGKTDGAKESKLNFVLQIPEETAKQLKVTLKLQNVPYAEVIRYVTEAVGLRFYIEEHAVVIYATEKKSPEKQTTEKPQ